MTQRQPQKNRKLTSVLKLTIAVISVIALFFIYKLYVEYRPAMLFPKWKDYKVVGIDVSKYQGDIDWFDLQAQNISFVFMKATEGNKIVDRNFNNNWRFIKKTEIVRGAYHFYRPHISWKTQAELFKSTVHIEKGDLPPVLDVEIIHSAGQEDLIADMKKWLQDIEKHYGMKPIVYTYENFYNNYLLEEFRGYNLWIAKYHNSRPTLNDDGHWEFWQYTEKGSLHGIKHPVDMNVFYGSKKQLKKILKK